MRLHETYKCNKCGNEVEVSHVGGGTLSCCGQDMECTTTDLTMVNLMKAFAGESQARNKYEFFANVARGEGYNDIAEHFDRAANNEQEHAKLEYKLHNRMKNGESYGDTLANLQDGIKGESWEHVTMYPGFEAIAKEEGHKEAARLFAGIGAIELTHEDMYRELYERLSSGKEFESDNEDEEWICEKCGHIHKGKKAPKVCPVCKNPQKDQSRRIEAK
jgi:desulfoferrodoxin-like iron-binding protein